MTEPQVSMAMKPPTPPTTPHQNQADKADDMLAAKIKHALEANHQLGQRAIAHTQVTVNDSVVTLTGHVARAVNSEQAEAATREVPGVVAVVNLLTGDYELMIDVAQALGHNQETQSEQIQVNVRNGVVYLDGTVNSASVRTASTQIAARISQARGIVNVIKTPGLVQGIDEERFVQPLIGRAVYSTDGQVGHLRRVIINPQNRRVTALVVHAQFSPDQQVNEATLSTERLQPWRDILIPIDNIRCAPSGALFLNVTTDKATPFDGFDQHDFATPPVEWLPPYPYALADVQFCKGS